MKIYLIAVEPSADQLGAELAKELKKAQPNINLAGIGGDQMRAVGIPSQMNIDGLAILGITEALKKLPLVYRKISEAAERVEAAKADAVIFLDSYGFMVRLAERLRKRGSKDKFIKYVAPQVWAMRPSRAQRVARLFDGLLTLHPFEPKFFTPLGLQTEYVGNAVFDRDYRVGNPDAIRQQYGLENQPILSVFFGSRASEVAQLAGPFADTVIAMKQKIPDLAVISPVSASVAEEVGAAAGQDMRLNEIILLPEVFKLDAMACSTAALACSGTVTTQLACAGVPSVVAYRLSPISYALVRRMLKLDYISMVNIAADKALMPEFVQDDVTAEKLSAGLLPYFEDEKEREQSSRALLAQTGEMRGSEDETASARAARAVLNMLS